jgi:ubiquinone/menaquinone biosynthesis C-methylase UbiE
MYSSGYLGSILVDPLGKEKLSLNENFAISQYGSRYPFVGKVIDFRLLQKAITQDEIRWREGQIDYERWHRTEWLDRKVDYIKELDDVSEMYQRVDFSGKDIIDIGGNCGTLRFHYVIIDPYVNALEDARQNSELVRALPFILDDCDFLCANAEFLPIKSSSFDIAHVRSVIDHVYNPSLAISECFRVLRNMGTLIIGTAIAKNESSSTKRKTISSLARDLIRGNVDENHDHHTWRPTLKGLENLVLNAGFEIRDLRFQGSFNGNVVYVIAQKVVY